MSPEQKAAFMARIRGEEAMGVVNRITHVIAVASGKGGVGKSSVAALLAIALGRDGFRVGILDADITGPSIPKIFGVSHTWQLPHGEGGRGVDLQCPQCDSRNIHREDKASNGGRHGRHQHATAGDSEKSES